MSQDILLSVIVPVYNAAPYLRKCVDSILCQTYGNLEIILVVDGGSKDNSTEICEEYAERDPRIKVLYRPHEGLVSARKAGVRAASGEYIAYVDSDDWLEPDAYERLTTIMGDRAPDVVIHGFWEEYDDYSLIFRCGLPAGYYDAAGMKAEVYPRLLRVGEMDRVMLPSGSLDPGVSADKARGSVRHGVQLEIPVTVWSKLVRRELLTRSQMMVPDHVTIGEDIVCTIYTLCMAESVMATDQTPYHYRIYSTSASRGQIPLEEHRTLFNAARSAFRNHPLADTYAKHLYRLTRDNVLLNWYELFLRGAYSELLFGRLDGLKVALYGAGKFGQEIYRKTTVLFPDRIALWVDRNDQAYQKTALPVKPVSALSEQEYDVVVIALLEESICKEIKENLVAMGVPPDKIRYLSESAELMEAVNRILNGT